MRDIEKLHFKIGLSGSSPIKQPQFSIGLDDQIFHSGFLTSGINDIEYFEFDAEISEGPHELKIELLNKNSKDTIKDSSGNIESDLLLNIDHIEIDEIDIATLKWSESIYNPTYPPEYLDEEQKSITDVKNCVTLGWNGTWRLQFQSPFYLWLLEKF